MTSWTLAYFVALAFWWIASSVALAAPIWSSWKWSAQKFNRGTIATSYEMTCGHFAALAALPIVVVVAVHGTLAAMGPEITRGSPPPEVGTSLVVNAPLPATVVVIWLLGTGASLAWLGGNALRLGRLRGRLRPASPALRAEIDALIADWPDPSRPLVRASATTPFVMGLRKPVLAVPDSLLALPAAQRRAVLLHELAHVARRDYAANLVQRLLLALLWLNPAAWWLYRHLNREREACCDRMAIARGASPTALAEALIGMAEARSTLPALMATTGGRSALSWRLGRLLGDDETVPTNGGVLRGTSALTMLAGTCAMVGVALGKSDTGLTDRYIASVFGPVVAVRAHDPAGSFALRIRQGRVIQASVDRVPLRPADIVQRGDRVLLAGAVQRLAVPLQVSPVGRIYWQARARR